jgi:long-chain acyl-CoA synthetase
MIIPPLASAVVESDPVAELLERMAGFGQAPCLYWQGRYVDYRSLIDSADDWGKILATQGVGQGSVCGVVADFSPFYCGLFFALLRVGAIIVPFSPSVGPELGKLADIARLDVLIRMDKDDSYNIDRLRPEAPNELIADFRQRAVPGLVLFSSGSTGLPKGILHDCPRLLRKFLVQRPGHRSILFLLIDHIGGVNTMLATFASGGLGVCPLERTPDSVCRAIDETSAELLPTSPTFLNLLYASGAWKKFNLSSLRTITYGTEVMSDATLENVRRMFPDVRLKQTYGLSELGILRSKSESDTSAWVKVGGEGFEIKVVDEILWIRAESNMVGYLNAPNPFDKDGWFCTDDMVEVKGDMLRFLGRRTELINVGGQKVYPVEVETVLLEAGNIEEVTVYGQDHPILGKVPVARVSLAEPEDAHALSLRLRRHCQERLARFKVPMRFNVVTSDAQRGNRFKKMRKIDDDAGQA